MASILWIGACSFWPLFDVQLLISGVQIIDKLLYSSVVIVTYWTRSVQNKPLADILDQKRHRKILVRCSGQR